MIVEIPRGTNRKMETLVGKFDKTLLDKKEEKTPEKNNPEKKKKFEDRYFKYLNDQLGKCNPIIQDYKEGKFRTVPALYHEEQVNDFLNSNIPQEDNDKYKELYGDNLEKGYNLCSYGAIPQTFESQGNQYKDVKQFLSSNENSGDFPGALQDVFEKFNKIVPDKKDAGNTIKEKFNRRWRPYRYLFN